MNCSLETVDDRSTWSKITLRVSIRSSSLELAGAARVALSCVFDTQVAGLHWYADGANAPAEDERTVQRAAALVKNFMVVVSKGLKSMI